MIKAEISMRVGRRIASLQWTPHMEQKVLRHMREHTKPKAHYRLSLVLATILLMALLLATATAALLGWQPFANRVLQLEPESPDGFRGWPLESKLALVEEMRAADMDVSMFSDIIQNPKDDQDALLTQKLEQVWSGELAYASGNILEHVRGPFYTWSLADKAWFSRKLIENNRLSEADEINLLPGPTDYSRENAVQKAESLLLAAYGHINRETLYQLMPAVYYYQLQKQPETNFWKVEYRDDHGAILYTATFQADGANPVLTRIPTEQELAEATRQSEREATELETKIRRLESEKGDALYWSLQDKAEHLGDKLPSPDDLPPEEALRRAREAIVARYDVTMDEVEALPWGVYFMEYQTKSLAFADYYAFTFVVDEMHQYSVGIDAKSGDIVLIQSPGEGNG